MKNLTKNLLDALILGDTLEATQTRSRRSLLPLNIQLFANGGAGGDGGNDGGNGGNDDAGGTGGTGGTDGAGSGGTGNDGADDGKGGQDDGDKKDDLDKIVQSRVDRLMADERKEKAKLERELKKLREEKLTDDERKQLEIDEREKAIKAKEKEVAEKENRLFAIKAIKDAGLDDGGDTTALVDLVVAGSDVTEDSITDKVKAVKDFIDKKVKAEVDKTFKDNGRNPNGAGNGSGDDKGNVSIAEKLGKQKAEQSKRANDVLSIYTGGNKK
jgi:hypothetical protein